MQIHNPSADAVEVPLYGLHFAPGETKEVNDEIGTTLGAPLVGENAVTQAQDELAKAQADLAAAEAAKTGGNS